MAILRSARLGYAVFAASDVLLRNGVVAEPALVVRRWRPFPGCRSGFVWSPTPFGAPTLLWC
jgi:hypothetical protein